MVVKVRKRSAARKQAARECDSERFNLRKMSELKVRIQYQIKISNRFADFENLNDTRGLK